MKSFVSKNSQTGVGNGITPGGVLPINTVSMFTQVCTVSFGRIFPNNAFSFQTILSWIILESLFPHIFPDKYSRDILWKGLKDWTLENMLNSIVWQEMFIYKKAQKYLQSDIQIY